MSSFRSNERRPAIRSEAAAAGVLDGDLHVVEPELAEARRGVRA